MSEQPAPIIPSALFAGFGALLGVTMAVVGGLRLGAAAISLTLILWVLLPLIGLPLALWSAYHLYGLLTASYRLDRDGFEMRWGLARESAPLSEVKGVAAVAVDQAPAPSGINPPGLLLGAVARNDESYEYFAARSGALVLVEFSEGGLFISPSDPDEFVEAFVSATRMGSLDPKPRTSERANLLTARLWRDQAARWLLVAGLLLPLGLIGYLGAMAGSIPAEVPFGFAAAGGPGPLAPPGRLLLLALLNGLIWLVNLLIGAWFYPDRRQRSISYGLWGLSLIVGGLFWGAIVQMVGMVT